MARAAIRTGPARDTRPEVLRDYRSRVGQEEAATACRQFLATVRRDAEGPRYPWHDVDAAAEPAWRAAFSESAPSVDVDAPCPVCAHLTLRRYFRAYDSGRAGYWEWCSTCFSYAHYSARLPDWWRGSDELDRVPMGVLEHSPEFLERALRLARTSSG